MQFLATGPGLQALCEHVLAAPGSKARSDLTCTSLQRLATEPGLEAWCKHVLATHGSEARSALTCTSLQSLALHLYPWPNPKSFQIIILSILSVIQETSGTKGAQTLRANLRGFKLHRGPNPPLRYNSPSDAILLPA